MIREEEMIGPKGKDEAIEDETYESKGQRHASEPKSYLESYEGGARDPGADEDLNVN